MKGKGIPLKDIFGSPVLKDQVKVSGIDQLRQLADEQAALATKGKEKPSVIRIVHTVDNTTIDLSLSNVTEMTAALQAIGYIKKEGLIHRFFSWLI